MPYKSNSYDAGWDLRSNIEDFKLAKGGKIEVRTGVKFAIPKGQVGIIAPRSGLGVKHRVGLANTIGVIDSDYRGEIIVWLVNDGYEDIEIKRYDRFCQMLILPVNVQTLNVTPALAETARGENGFGSTGTRE
jgi:dUTP pyrophosphatase